METTRQIAADHAEAAERWERTLIERIQRVVAFPNSGRVVPEYNRTDLREVIHGRYRMVYRVTSSHVIIVRILEGHRQLPDESSLA